MKTVAFSYGLFEGPALSRAFRKRLKERGFTATKSLQNAEYIISHSGGVYFLPQTMKAKKILLIGPPLWPNKKMSRSIKEKLISDGLDSATAQKLMKNTRYALTNIRRSLSMRSMHQRNAQYNFDTEVVLIRNSDDTFLHHESATELARDRKWTFIHFDGGHDDLWIEVDRYIDLLET